MKYLQKDSQGHDKLGLLNTVQIINLFLIVIFQNKCVKL